MLSLQQQNNMINNNNNQHFPPINTMMPSVINYQTSQPPPQQQQQQENQYDHSSVNSQQCLADKIQAVRHLWESENQHSNSSYVHRMLNYNQQKVPPAVSPGICSHMNTIF